MEQRELGSTQEPELHGTERRWDHLRHIAGAALRAAGCIVAATAPGAVGGAVAGLGLATHDSVPVTVLPGVEARVQLVNGTNSEVSFERLDQYSCFQQLPNDIVAGYISPALTQKPAGSINLTHAHADVRGMLEVGARATITRIDCNTETLQALADMAHSDKAATGIIENPIITAVETKAIEDIETLAFAGGMTTLMIAASIRRVRQSFAELTGETAQTPHGQYVPSALAIAMSSLLMCGTGAAVFGASAIHPPHSNQRVSTYITNQIPFLQGASVNSDSLLAALDTSTVQVIEERNDIDKYYAGVQQNLERALTTWLTNPHNHAILANTDLVPSLAISGRHCSDPMAEAISPLITHELKPLVLFDTGNVDVAPNLPLHDFCVSLLQKSLEAAVQASGKNVYMFAVAGKHDAMQATLSAEPDLRINGSNGAPYHPIVPFSIEDTHTYTRYGIHVIGGSSPVESPDGEPDTVRIPGIDHHPRHGATPQQQNEAYYQAGQSALLACQADNNNAIVPIALFNSREQGYPVLQHCATSLVLAGEGPTGFFTYDQYNGNNATLFIEGSSAGNGESCYDFRPYQRIVGSAQYIFMLLDPTTNKVAYEANLGISPSGTVSISMLAPPAAHEYDHSIVEQFNASHGSSVHSAQDKQVQDPSRC
ncbi:MAG TPA: hypothetical protein VFN56_02375 [Candidatus Saccharimonadales bacterium]|nr:hypothetical protein [Candidatus Saccharimonadales bacterium]